MSSGFQQGTSWWIIGLSFFFGFLLAVFPLPMSWGWFRPEFIALLVIYWSLQAPEQMGLGTAFVLGLLQDLLEFAPLGQHALALVAVAYVCEVSYRRLSNYALWQQALWVFILVGLHQLFWNWVHGFAGPSAESLIFLLPALISAFCWPLLLLAMAWLRWRLRPSYRQVFR